MALEVGHIYARLDAVFDDDNFRRYDKYVDSARTDAKRPITTELRADVDQTGFRQYDSATRRAHTSTRTLGDTARRTGGHLRGLAVGAAGAAAAYIGLSQVKGAITATTDLAKATAGLHGNLALTTREASSWSAVAKSRDIEAKALAMSFGTLSKNVDAATHGGSEQEQMFRRLGFTTRELKKDSGDFNELLLDTSDHMREMGAGGERTALGMRLLGRGWQTVMPLMRDGSEELEKNIDAAGRFGAAMGKDAVDDTMRLVTAQRHLKLAQTGLQIQFTRAMTPAIIDATKQFTHLAEIMNSKHLTSDEKFAKIADILRDDFEDVVDVAVSIIPEIAENVGEQAPKIAGALIEGFLNADSWGKLAIGGWLISKMGGWKAVTALGGLFGKRFGAAAVPGIVAGEATVAAGAAGTTGAAAKAEGNILKTTAGKVGAGGAAGAAASTPYGAIILGAGAATLGVHELMDKLGDLMEKEDAADRATEILGGQYGDLGKDAEQLAGKIKTAGEQTEDAFAESEKHDRPARFKEEIPAEIQLIRKLKKEHGSFAAAALSMSEKHRSAWESMAMAAHENGDLTGKQLDKFRHAFEFAETIVSKRVDKIAKATGESAKQIRKSVDVMSTKVSEDYEGMVEVSGGGLTWLTSKTSEALASLGVAKEVKFNANFHKENTHAGGGKWAGSTGGIVNGPYSIVDNVPAMLRGHERVLRPEDHTPTVDTAMRVVYGLGLDDYLKRTGGTGYGSGGKARGFAGGGMVTGDTDYMPALGTALERMAQATNTSIYVNSGGRTMAEQAALYARYLAGGTLAAKPDPNAPHVSGRAADIAPGREAFGSVAGRFGLGFTVPSESWHIELLNAGAGGAMAVGGSAPQIPRVVLDGPPGPLKDTGQASLDKAHKAAQALVDREFARSSAAMTSSGALTSADGAVASTFARVAKQKSSSKRATMALGEAGYAESGMRDLSYGDSSSEGALQLLASTAAGMGINPHDEGQVSDAFLTRGYWNYGSANSLAARGMSPELVAHMTQGNSTGTGVYAAQSGAAQAWMRRYGLARGGLVPDRGALMEQLLGSHPGAGGRRGAFRRYSRVFGVAGELAELGGAPGFRHLVGQRFQLPRRFTEPVSPKALELLRAYGRLDPAGRHLDRAVNLYRRTGRLRDAMEMLTPSGESISHKRRGTIHEQLDKLRKHPGQNHTEIRGLEKELAGARRFARAGELHHRLLGLKLPHPLGALSDYARTQRGAVTRTLDVARSQRPILGGFAAGGRVPAMAAAGGGGHAPVIIVQAPPVELHAHGGIGPLIEVAEVAVDGKLNALARRTDRARAATPSGRTVFGG